ncbi:MAG: TolC family protein, partial [Polaribacter sp.]|nr:TolC family protein [Polaribacter sp.]
ATDAQAVVARENDLNIALLNLAQLILVPIENFDVASVDVGTPSAVLLYNSSDVVYQKSLTTQPQIERASLAIKNEELNIELTKGSFLPTLSLNAGVFTNYGFNLNLPPGFSNQTFGTQLSDNLGYGVGFNINIPIFNRFQTKNRLERAKISKEVRELAYENEKLTLQQTIEQAYLDVKAALKTFEAANVSLASQEEAYKNAQESFNYGAITLFDFELIRIRLVNAEAAMIRAKYDYVFRTKVLQFFSGELIFD